MAIAPNIPVVNLGYSDLQGGRLSWLTGTTMTVASGQFRNSTNQNDIVLSAAVTINTAANGANGLDVGVMANNLLYAVYVIASSKAGDTTSDDYVAPAGMLSLSFTAPTLPGDYDMFRRIGTVKASGAAALLDFTQRGNGKDRDMYYGAVIATAVVAGNATTFTLVDCSALVPSTAGEIILKADLTPGAAGRFVSLRATGSTSAAGQNTMSGDVAAVVHSASMTTPCTTIAAVTSFDYLVSNAGDAVALSVYGYVDQL